MIGQWTLSNISGILWAHLTLFQALQILETVHCYLKIVSSDTFTTFIQVLSRMIMLGCLYFYPKTQQHYTITIMFTVWTVSEMIRYFYFVCNAHKYKVKNIRKIRYTVPVLLYPIGAVLEIIFFINNRHLAYHDPKITNHDYFLIYVGITGFIVGGSYIYAYLLTQRFHKNQGH